MLLGLKRYSPNNNRGDRTRRGDRRQPLGARRGSFRCADLAPVRRWGAVLLVAKIDNAPGVGPPLIRHRFMRGPGTGRVSALDG
jgi:hypothetical protein